MNPMVIHGITPYYKKYLFLTLITKKIIKKELKQFLNFSINLNTKV